MSWQPGLNKQIKEILFFRKKIGKNWLIFISEINIFYNLHNSQNLTNFHPTPSTFRTFSTPTLKVSTVYILPKKEKHKLQISSIPPRMVYLPFIFMVNLDKYTRILWISSEATVTFTKVRIRFFGSKEPKLEAHSWLQSSVWDDFQKATKNSKLEHSMTGCLGLGFSLGDGF